MSTTTVAAPTDGIDYETPATTPHERVQRLEELVKLFERERTFSNAQLVCMNVRFAWGGIYVDGKQARDVAGEGVWEVWELDEQLLQPFIEATDLAVLLVPTAVTDDDTEYKLRRRYRRSCLARLVWARQLARVKARTPVRLAMAAYVETVLKSDDPID